MDLLIHDEEYPLKKNLSITVASEYRTSSELNSEYLTIFAKSLYTLKPI
ncbi:4431_t:CDS:2 [Funneliformis mosseae]|uniref:4431_t:CDS:1 n=1 Tax=Funneliformis mosseae TaxID=27381 RepID=A0A9N9HKU4_FUNMO|nr:4431_t:CDS:2 [Funneliformis mosseae]